MEYFFIHLD